jgi:hypothetical protein
MRKILFVLVALSLIASLGLTACGSVTQKPIPVIKYQGDGCDATQFPLNKDIEITTGVTVNVNWVQRFVRDDITVTGAWVFAFNENGNRRVMAFGESMGYSSTPGEGWSGMPSNQSITLSAYGQDGTAYAFASVNSDDLELLLMCEPLAQQNGANAEPPSENAPDAPAGYCAYTYSSGSNEIVTPFGAGLVDYGEYEIHYTITNGGQEFEDFVFVSTNGQWKVKYSGSGGDFVSIGDTFTFTDSTTGLLVLFFETQTMKMTVYGTCSGGSLDA